MFERKVSAYIERKKLLHQGDRVLVGVSGGPDSTALLYYLHQISSELDLSIRVAHVDHMFRGEESYEDYLYVQDVCKRLKIPFNGQRINVPEHIDRTGKNSQQASRDCRYNFYQELMDEYKMNKLALAHHMDDQAESVLMNLVRGGAGMARGGMPAERPFAGGKIIRPFLAVTREEVMEFCSRMNLTPRTDSSNQKDVYTRNRFRKYILPLLKKENPKALQNIQRFSENLHEDETFLQSLAKREFDLLKMTEENGVYSIAISSLQAVPIPLQRRVIHLILNYLYQMKPYVFSYVHIEDTMSLLMDTQPSLSLQLPQGLHVSKAYDQLLFHFGDFSINKICEEVSIPGLTMLPNGDRIETSILEKSDQQPSDAFTCVLPFRQESLPLRVRNKKDGDRYQPIGFTGHKKLKKLFMERKVPIHQRQSWPLIVDRDDQIIWIPGLQKVTIDQTPNPPYIMMKYIESSSSRRTNE